MAHFVTCIVADFRTITMVHLNDPVNLDFCSSISKVEYQPDCVNNILPPMQYELRFNGVEQCGKTVKWIFYEERTRDCEYDRIGKERLR